MLVFDPAEKDFEKIRTYPADELTVDQMEIIRSNTDKLNDEEKSAFDFLLDDADDGDGGGGDTPPADKQNADGGDDGGNTPPADKQPSETPKDQKFAFTSKEEADAYIADMIAKKQEEAKQKADEARLEAEKKSKAFDPKYKAENVEELYQQFRNRLKAETDEDIATRERLQRDIDKRLDNELQSLEKDGKIPARTSEEGKKAVGQLAEIARTYKFASFNEAYDIWHKLPEQFGGGYKVAAAPEDNAEAEAQKKKEQLANQKARAARVAGGKGDGGASKKTLPYDKMKNMNLDDVVDFALSQ